MSFSQIVIYLFCPQKLKDFALLEAMSYGNCCLISNIPENMEALNGLGYVFKNKNIEDLSKKLEFLIMNPEKVNCVKKQAKAYVLENYLWDNIAIKFEELYKDVLSE